MEVVLEYTASQGQPGLPRSYLKKKKRQERKGKKEKRRRKSKLEVTETLPKVPSQKPCRWTGPVGCPGRTPGEYGGLWQTTPPQPGLGARSAGEDTTLRKTGTREGSVIPG